MSDIVEENNNAQGTLNDPDYNQTSSSNIEVENNNNIVESECNIIGTTSSNDLTNLNISEMDLSKIIENHNVPLPQLINDPCLINSESELNNNENNWILKQSDYTQSDESVRMVVPAPKEIINVLIGNKTTDEISDLSDAPSVYEDFDNSELNNSSLISSITSNTNSMDEFILPPPSEFLDCSNSPNLIQEELEEILDKEDDPLNEKNIDFDTKSKRHSVIEFLAAVALGPVLTVCSPEIEDDLIKYVVEDGNITLDPHNLNNIVDTVNAEEALEVDVENENICETNITDNSKNNNSLSEKENISKIDNIQIESVDSKLAIDVSEQLIIEHITETSDEIDMKTLKSSEDRTNLEETTSLEFLNTEKPPSGPIEDDKPIDEVEGNTVDATTELHDKIITFEKSKEVTITKNNEQSELIDSDLRVTDVLQPEIIVKISNECKIINNDENEILLAAKSELDVLKFITEEQPEYDQNGIVVDSDINSAIKVATTTIADKVPKELESDVLKHIIEEESQYAKNEAAGPGDESESIVIKLIDSGVNSAIQPDTATIEAKIPKELESDVLSPKIKEQSQNEENETVALATDIEPESVVINIIDPDVNSPTTIETKITNLEIPQESEISNCNDLKTECNVLKQNERIMENFTSSLGTKNILQTEPAEIIALQFTEAENKTPSTIILNLSKQENNQIFDSENIENIREILVNEIEMESVTAIANHELSPNTDKTKKNEAAIILENLENLKNSATNGNVNVQTSEVEIINEKQIAINTFNEISSDIQLVKGHCIQNKRTTEKIGDNDSEEKKISLESPIIMQTIEEKKEITSPIINENNNKELGHVSVTDLSEITEIVLETSAEVKPPSIEKQPIHQNPQLSEKSITNIEIITDIKAEPISVHENIKNLDNIIMEESTKEVENISIEFNPSVIEKEPIEESSPQISEESVTNIEIITDIRPEPISVDKNINNLVNIIKEEPLKEVKNVFVDLEPEIEKEQSTENSPQISEESVTNIETITDIKPEQISEIIENENKLENIIIEEPLKEAENISTEFNPPVIEKGPIEENSPQISEESVTNIEIITDIRAEPIIVNENINNLDNIIIEEPLKEVKNISIEFKTPEIEKVQSTENYPQISEESATNIETITDIKAEPISVKENINILDNIIIEEPLKEIKKNISVEFKTPEIEKVQSTENCPQISEECVTNIETITDIKVEHISESNENITNLENIIMEEPLKEVGNTSIELNSPVIETEPIEKNSPQTSEESVTNIDIITDIRAEPISVKENINILDNIIIEEPLKEVKNISVEFKTPEIEKVQSTENCPQISEECVTNTETITDIKVDHISETNENITNLENIILEEPLKEVENISIELNSPVIETGPIEKNSPETSEESVTNIEIITDIRAEPISEINDNLNNLKNIMMKESLKEIENKSEIEIETPALTSDLNNPVPLSDSDEAIELVKIESSEVNYFDTKRTALVEQSGISSNETNSEILSRVSETLIKCEHLTKPTLINEERDFIETECETRIENPEEETGLISDPITEPVTEKNLTDVLLENMKSNLDENVTEIENIATAVELKTINESEQKLSEDINYKENIISETDPVYIEKQVEKIKNQEQQSLDNLFQSKLKFTTDKIENNKTDSAKMYVPPKIPTVPQKIKKSEYTKNRPSTLDFDSALHEPSISKLVTFSSLKFLQPKRKLIEPYQILPQYSLENSTAYSTADKIVIEDEVKQSLPSVKALARAFLATSVKVHPKQKMASVQNSNLNIKMSGDDTTNDALTKFALEESKPPETPTIKNNIQFFESLKKN